MLPGSHKNMNGKGMALPTTRMWCNLTFFQDYLIQWECLRRKIADIWLLHFWFTYYNCQDTEIVITMTIKNTEEINKSDILWFLIQSSNTHQIFFQPYANTKVLSWEAVALTLQLISLRREIRGKYTDILK